MKVTSGPGKGTRTKWRCRCPDACRPRRSRSFHQIRQSRRNRFPSRAIRSDCEDGVVARDGAGHFRRLFGNSSDGALDYSDDDEEMVEAAEVSVNE